MADPVIESSAATEEKKELSEAKNNNSERNAIFRQIFDDAFSGDQQERKQDDETIETTKELLIAGFEEEYGNALSGRELESTILNYIDADLKQPDDSVLEEELKAQVTNAVQKYKAAIEKGDDTKIKEEAQQGREEDSALAEGDHRQALLEQLLPPGEELYDDAEQRRIYEEEIVPYIGFTFDIEDTVTTIEEIDDESLMAIREAIEKVVRQQTTREDVLEVLMKHLDKIMPESSVLGVETKNAEQSDNADTDSDNSGDKKEASAKESTENEESVIGDTLSNDLEEGDHEYPSRKTVKEMYGSVFSPRNPFYADPNTKKTKGSWIKPNIRSYNPQTGMIEVKVGVGASATGFGEIPVNDLESILDADLREEATNGIVQRVTVAEMEKEKAAKVIAEENKAEYSERDQNEDQAVEAQGQNNDTDKSGGQISPEIADDSNDEESGKEMDVEEMIIQEDGMYQDKNNEGEFVRVTAVNDDTVDFLRYSEKEGKNVFDKGPDGSMDKSLFLEQYKIHKLIKGEQQDPNGDQNAQDPAPEDSPSEDTEEQKEKKAVAFGIYESVWTHEDAAGEIFMVLPYDEGADDLQYQRLTQNDDGTYEYGEKSSISKKEFLNDFKFTGKNIYDAPSIKTDKSVEGIDPNKTEEEYKDVTRIQAQKWLKVFSEENRAKSEVLVREFVGLKEKYHQALVAEGYSEENIEKEWLDVQHKYAERMIDDFLEEHLQNVDPSIRQEMPDLFVAAIEDVRSKIEQ